MQENNVKIGVYMEQRLVNFDESLKWGQESEREVASKLLNNGVVALPLYQFTSSMAPILLAVEEMKQKNYICPDLICFNNSAVYFAEVKRKTNWVNFTGKNETGIDMRSYEQYKALSDKTGVPFYIVFVHEGNNGPSGIFITNIKNEHTRSWDGRDIMGNYRGKPEIFFVSESLKKWE